jgi:hypothetical protein
MNGALEFLMVGVLQMRIALHKLERGFTRDLNGV